MGNYQLASAHCATSIEAFQTVHGPNEEFNAVLLEYAAGMLIVLGE